MKISAIIAKIVESQEAYKIFDEDSYRKSVQWIELLTTLPADKDMEFVGSISETDIMVLLDSNANLFQEEAYIPDVIEGFQIIEDEEHDDEIMALKEELAILEEQNRNLTDMTEIFNNQLEAIEEDKNNLVTKVEELQKENEALKSSVSQSLLQIQPRVMPIEAQTHVQAAPPMAPVSVASFGADTADKPALANAGSYNVSTVPVDDDDEDDDFAGGQDDVQELHDEYVEHDDEAGNTASDTGKKKFTPKKIALICATLVVSGGMIYTLLAPKGESKPQPVQTSLATPSIPALPVQLPMPTLQQMSSSKTTAIVAPKAEIKQPVSAKVEATATVAKPTPVEAPIPKRIERERIKYNKNGNAVSLRQNQGLRVYLSNDEKVTDVEGKDTDNWTIKYNQGKNYITITPKSNNITNEIIIKTTKRDYKLDAVSEKRATNAPVEFQY